MPIIKNPFRRNIPITDGTPEFGGESPDDFSGADSPRRHGSKPSLALDIKNEAPNEFKMSVVTDGRYLPPSPTERKSFFSRSFNSSTSSRRMPLADEPFSISRESFDSYRRSFDISARSPIASPTFPRQSLDARLPKIRQYESIDSQTEEKTSDDEDEFDDVMLEGDKPRKKGLFSFNSNTSRTAGAPANHSFFFGGRKRGLSGQGAELKSMEDSRSEAQAV